MGHSCQPCPVHLQVAKVSHQIHRLGQSVTDAGHSPQEMGDRHLGEPDSLLPGAKGYQPQDCLLLGEEC